jgi:hypothetical protein
MDTRIIVIKENKEVLSLIAPRGSDNHFLFSEAFIHGDTEKAIQELILSSNRKVFSKSTTVKNEKNTLLAPEKYGTTIINLHTKTIDYLSEIPAFPFKRFSSFVRELYVEDFKNELIIKYVEENLLSIIDVKNNQSYSIKEFFDTTSVKKIEKLLDNKVKQMISKGAISNYATLELEEYGFFIKPSAFDLTLNTYEAINADKLFIKLIKDGLEFSQDDLSIWKNYLNEFKAPQVFQNIQTYVTSLNEKTQLESQMRLPNKSSVDKMKI